MAFRDVLLTLTSYPEPTPVSVVEDAVAVAAALGAHIAGLSCEMNVQLPGHFISGSIVGLPGIIAGEAAKSRRNCERPDRSIRRSHGEVRRFPRIDPAEMQVVRGAGPPGRICAAS